MNNHTAKTKTALVTGANRGIGRAIAKGLAAKRDIRVLAAARRVKEAQAAVESIGNGTVGVELNLSDPLTIEPRVLEIEADGFLYNMVRNIVGTLVLVGRGDRPVSWVAEVLASRDRGHAGPTAPPQGLTLLQVAYET